MLCLGVINLGKVILIIVNLEENRGLKRCTPLN